MINDRIQEAMRIKLPPELPPPQVFQDGIRRAPHRGFRLSRLQTETALRNALRYVPAELHEALAPEFMEELVTRGRIYGYRFRPEGKISGKPVDQYKGKCLEGRAVQVMMDNNLDFDVALYPYELVTYGETGQVCQNWMQYRLIKGYLEELNRDQTLVIMSGHPLGLFRSGPEAPRVILTNGLLVGLYDNLEDWEIAAEMGVTNYGQMTAGGLMYIGPQGIVHGTYNTVLNAGRLKLNLPAHGNLEGVIFVSSGLGGMSGAQPKAVEIAGGVGIVAEVDHSRIETRHRQGWVDMVTADPAEAVKTAENYRSSGRPYSIAFHGNIVDLLQFLVDNKIDVPLMSDQTSCHNAYQGGYCPQGITFEERTRLLSNDQEEYRRLVDMSLKKHFELVRTMVSRGTFFFDYGNSFMKAVYDAGAEEIARDGDPKNGFIFPSYVESIMGPMLFDLGYGPFRWVCLSGEPRDLEATDRAAMECIDPHRSGQDRDNYNWIRDAGKNMLVVGTQARILYQNAKGRTRIALRFNRMVREGKIGPVMLGRDHHDTGGTDSPFRETANIKDGSNVCADMATHCFAGNAARGMSLVALHNGGGVGIGKAVNGGFGMVLDGSERVDRLLKSAMPWDVMCGVARRAWARNKGSMEVCAEYNLENAGGDHITLPCIADDELVRKSVDRVLR